MNQGKYIAAKGCLLGAFVGDAAGATLEFLGHTPTIEEVTRAMDLPGGGKLQVAPGQITDDGELTLCLAQALAASNTFDLEKIARSYAKWIESDPFDIGITTSSSLGSFRPFEMSDVLKHQRSYRAYAKTMTVAASKHCTHSKANGSLMRITPLGIWGHDLEVQEIAHYARLDTSLSHPNPSCVYAVACYIIAIASLIQQPGKRELAFDRAKSWLNSQENVAKQQRESTSWKEVSSWLSDAEYDVDIPYLPHIGFIKIAFTHAFRHLLLGSDYETAIKETLLGGGDTDTNACIVGGLIGAAVGIDGVPENMCNGVLNCDTSLGKNPRPAFLHPRQVEQLIPPLLE